MLVIQHCTLMQGICLRGKARAILHTTAGVVLGYNNEMVDQLKVPIYTTSMVT